MSQASPTVNRPHRHYLDRDALDPVETPWLGHMARTLARYRNAILLSLAAIALACLLGALTAYLLQPTHRVTTMEFRLDFQGAERGQYPNGTKFSTADITSTAVLMNVYNANDLKRFFSFTEFSQSVYILESNRALERLFLEYQNKLADPKLTPVDRERLESEYTLKRESVSRSVFSINFATNRTSRSVPATLIEKILNDTMAGWAQYAAREKGALNYALPIVSGNILDRSSLRHDDQIVAADVLRTRINTILRNIEELLRVPGATVLRTKKENMSLFEISVRLTDTLRFKVSPLLIRARAAGAAKPTTIPFLESQLTYNERAAASTASRAQALRESLNLYTQRQQQSGTEVRPAGGQQQAPAAQNGSGDRDVVMPQINESFIDRLVELSRHDRDFEYRQDLVDRITNEALRTLPYETEAAHYRELLASVRQSGIGGGGVAAQAFTAELESIYDDAAVGIRQINEIYALLSQSLNPSTVLYTVVRPPMRRVERDLEPSRLVMYSVLIFLASIPLVLLACLLHNRIREEVEEELQEDEAAV